MQAQIRKPTLSNYVFLALTSMVACINDPPEDAADGDTSTRGDETGDGDGDRPMNHGAPCTIDAECDSGNCMVIPFMTGRCGECEEDLDCSDGGCTSFNPFGLDAPTCNLGELGGGCESDAVCQPGLRCVNMLDLLGVIRVSTCSACASNLDCAGPDICAPIIDIPNWQGSAQCIAPGVLPPDSYCLLGGQGHQACASGICSVVDVLGVPAVGACGECLTDADCGNGTCVPGDFMFASGTLTGSTCQ